MRARVEAQLCDIVCGVVWNDKVQDFGTVQDTKLTCGEERYICGGEVADHR